MSALAHGITGNTTLLIIKRTTTENLNGEPTIAEKSLNAVLTACTIAFAKRGEARSALACRHASLIFGEERVPQSLVFETSHSRCGCVQIDLCDEIQDQIRSRLVCPPVPMTLQATPSLRSPKK